MQELSLHIMDIVQNSIVAGAHRIEIAVEQDTAADRLRVRIADDGCGMDAQMLARVESPFSTTRTTRKVGLGIPMFKHSAESTGGAFAIRSAPGKGTEVTASFGLTHIDRAPMGDLCGTIVALVAGNAALDFVFTARVDGAQYDMDTRQIRQVLGDEVPLDTPDVVLWIRSDIEEGLQSLHGGM